MCKVTVVIPNYNGEKYLVPCLASLYEETRAEIKVIVVDNGSKDDSLNRAIKLYPQTRIIRLDRNYGFCRAVNEGITASDTEYVLLLNNDTLVRKGKKYKKIEPEVAGTYHLNGVQAVSYSRIRYTEGGDFQRTSRQRLVIEKIAEEAKKADLSTINKIIDAVFPEITTSFTSGEIVKMSAGLLQYSIGDNEGFPMDNETPDSIPGYQGSYVVPKGLEENVIKLHKFLFPDEDYTPTDTLKEISDHIKDVTGIYPDDSEDSTEDNEE